MTLMALLRTILLRPLRMLSGKAIWLFGFAFLFMSCATYYQQNFNFNSEFEKGDLQSALTTLQKQERAANGKTQFLYYANNGLLESVLGKYEASNESFEKAFLFGEDYRINYVTEAASYLTNPNFATYRGEDHEHLMVLYFKAINFLKMGKKEEALVECRRLTIRLNQLSDKYSSPDKYQRDAFVHTLMGIIYQSSKDYNNAFIAYRNALEIYQGDYARMFDMQVPEQLKTDLLNMAWYTGFRDEFDRYRQEFNMPDFVASLPDADLVFFWHNGLAPVKSEWSINFVITPTGNNMFVFANAELNLSFPFYIDNDKDRNDLSRLQVFRATFPKYVERPVYFESATLKTDSLRCPLLLAEDINKVAFFSLRERMMLEFGKGLLRAALKKAAEQSLRKEDDRLGAVLGLVNAMTEKADTRNWQTLPHSIYYARMPMRAGTNKVSFNLQPIRGDVVNYDFSYTATKGQTLFHTFSSLETGGHPPMLR